MASTSTNKQPLLVDRVLYETVNSYALNLVSGNAANIDISGTNTSAVLVDCTTNDGALIEDMFAISRHASKQFTALFYFSNANDFLRPAQANFIGSIESPTGIGSFQNVTRLPRVLSPMPHVAVGPASGATQSDRSDEPLRNEALYVPRGRALWVTIQGTAADADAPIIGCQGGYY